MISEMRSKKLLITVAALTSILFMGIVAVDAVANQNDNGDSVIYAVYNRITGNLRIVTNDKIRPNEVPISWNIKGPQGPPGPQGEQGPPGDTSEFEQVLEEMNTQIQALEDRISHLEEKLEIYSPIGGSAFVSYNELNLSGPGLIFYSEPDIASANDSPGPDAGVNIEPINDGTVTIYINYFTLETSKAGELAAIEVNVIDNEVNISNIYSWVEGSTEGFTKDELGLTDIESREIDSSDIIVFVPLDLDMFGIYYVFALTEGEATITFTSSEEHVATIDVKVDADRKIEVLDINPYSP